MSDYLDAHQAARLECLKMLGATRATDVVELLNVAQAMARFIIDGTLPGEDKPA